MHLHHAALVAGALCACAEPPETSPTMVRVPLAAVPEPWTAICYGVATRDKWDRPVASVGGVGTGVLETDRASLEARGAVCVEAGAEAPTVTLPCTPGEGSALVWVLGEFDAAGAVAPEDTADPCGRAGCRIETTCVEHAVTTADAAWLIGPPSHHGFVDATVMAPRARGVCFDLRVTDESGALVWARSSVCSSDFGDGQGAITYIGNCYAKAPENTFAVWVHGPPETFEDDSGTDWAALCPGSSAGHDPATWVGGCTARFHCVENMDATLELTLSPATTP